MFLNPLLLAGIGGAVLPVILHLLNRARYRTLDWGAMMFLPGAQGRQERSNRLKQILLLLLRMTVVALLALALARPIVGASWAALGGDTQCCCVMLLDTSASMGYEEGNGQRIDSQRRAALAVLAGLQRGDEVTLLTLGDDRDPTDVPPPSDLQTAASRIADLRVSDGRADIASGLLAAARIFHRSTAPNRLLVLIGDRQAESWKNVTPTFAASWRASLGSTSTGGRAGAAHALMPETRFVVISVGSEACENVAIDHVEPPAAPVVRDVPVPLNVTLHNYGRQALTGLTLGLDIAGGHSSFQTSVDLPAGASNTVTLTPRFAELGTHVLRARIHPDAHVAGGLSFDDGMDAIVNVVDPLEICIISGDSTGESGEEITLDQAHVLRLALMPYQSAGEKGPDLANITLLGPASPWPENLEKFQVLILSDVAALDEMQARHIEQFVFDGGGLLIAPGDRLLWQNYNDHLFDQGTGPLPARLAPTTAPTSPTRILFSDLTHPAVSFLRAGSTSSFDAAISKYLGADVSETGGRIIAQLTDDSPLLIAKDFGRGRVVLATTTLGGSWSNLQQSSLLLPLVQSTVRYLASAGGDEQTLALHEPIDAHFIAATGDRGTGDRAVVALPDGSRQNVDLVQSGDRRLVRFTGTDHPGQYDVIVHGTHGDVTRSFIVQAARDESDLTPLTAQQWADLQRMLAFKRTPAESADVAALAASRQSGHELWFPLVGMTLLALLAESAFSRALSSET
jgi:hypothetical protein